MGQRHLVDRLAPVEERQGPLVTVAHACEVEILRLEERRNLRQRLGVDEDGSDYRFLGVGVVGEETLRVYDGGPPLRLGLVGLCCSFGCGLVSLSYRFGATLVGRVSLGCCLGAVFARSVLGRLVALALGCRLGVGCFQFGQVLLNLFLGYGDWTLNMALQ